MPFVGRFPKGVGDQAPLRHPETSPYRCFLPDLAGFGALRRAGPDPQHPLTIVRGLFAVFLLVRSNLPWRSRFPVRLYVNGKREIVKRLSRYGAFHFK